MGEYSGGCQCGRVRFVVSEAPRRVGLCHCLECRKHHGAVFYAAAVFPTTSVCVTGETNSYKGRHFCPVCGSSVFARSGDGIELHLGSFDTPNQFRPSYELWSDRREAWLPEFPGVERHSRNWESQGQDEPEIEGCQ